MSETDIAEQFGTGAWKFTPDVVQVFDEHVRASVPHYDVIQDLVAETTDWLVPAGGLVADLGASTGASARRIMERHPDRGLRFVLYDEQPAMLDQADTELRKLAAKLGGEVDVLLSPTRIQDGPLVHEDADLTLCLFTLQFLPRRERVKALQLARERAAESGALIVAEKIRAIDSRWAEIGTDVAHDYKAVRGISDSAIRAKAKALRGVLRPFPQQATADAMVAAGWHAPEVLFRWHSWAVIGAFASPH